MTTKTTKPTRTTKPTKAIDCVDCGASVPYGRLSCPACGALLAAVKRTRPTDDAMAVAAPPAVAARPGVAARPVVAARPAVAARPTSSASPTYLIDPIPEPFDELEPAAAPTPWPPLAQPGPNLVARPYSSGPALGAADPGHLAPPGAYLPPNARLAAATAGAADASVATASGAAVAGSAGATAVSLLDALPRLDAARLGDIGGGFVVVGSAMATLGFLLPWSDWVVGARSAGGYLDTWGLASPMHVLALSIVLLVLALGVVQTNVAPWFRSGVLGLLVGGLLIGLTWPYTIGPLGADFGANLTALGGLALVLGGGVATWACRHGDGQPLV